MQHDKNMYIYIYIFLTNFQNNINPLPINISKYLTNLQYIIHPLLPNRSISLKRSEDFRGFSHPSIHPSTSSCPRLINDYYYYRYNSRRRSDEIKNRLRATLWWPNTSLSTLYTHIYIYTSIAISRCCSLVPPRIKSGRTRESMKRRSCDG